MIGGLAGLIHLNSDFSTTNPTAAGTETISKILPQKRVLKNFIYSLDFIKMTKFNNFAVYDSDAVARAIAEQGEQYALYLFHGRRRVVEWPQGSNVDRFNINPGWYSDSVSLNVPGGTFKVEWINPVSGDIIDTVLTKWKGGELMLRTPHYFFDIALRMTKMSFPK
jgi:hypothetical protein